MAEHRLSRRVGEVADRLYRLATLKRQSKLCFGSTGLGVLLLAANVWLPTPLLSAPLTGLTAVLLLGACWAAARSRPTSLKDVAQAIEDRWPNLDSRLATAVDQRPNDTTGGFGFLQQQVISEALSHAHRNDWRETVPLGTLTRAKLQQLASLTVYLGVFAAAAWAAGMRPHSVASSSLAESNAFASKHAITVEPGDAVIERGSSLLVIARFAGELPREVVLHATDAAGTTTSQPLSRSLDDPLFGGRMATVETDLTYHVAYDGEQSDVYRVKVFDYPNLEQADATIVHPEYTGLGEKTIEDVRRVSLIEGSRLTLICRFNKLIAEAVLTTKDGTQLALAPLDAQDAALQAVTWRPAAKQVLTLSLVDADGRTNKNPPEFVIDVIPNQPPKVAVSFPAKDVRVSPLEEVSLEASAQDDFGLKEYGLIYQLPERDEESLKLGEESARDAKVTLAHQLALEDIDAQPNDLVSYYFYADDIGPDGGPRRTFSDMYFAEIRHFNEEFRQANSPEGQQPGEQQADTPSTQLLQLQRDIVNAIWKLIRREYKAEPSAEFPADAQTTRDSQQEAIELGQKLQQRQEDALAKQYLDDALGRMQVAADHLSQAADAGTVQPLPDARKAAYDAYQLLVKLNVREHLVQQSQSSSSSQQGRSGGDLERQLQQLELKNNRNRYETEQQEQPPADQEQLQVLNRLRELARRQGDLNQKIQELETALRAAETEQEREEIERQLKRLQEEQQQMLRDLDELQQRMESEENRSRMADAREQAHDVRQHLRESSEALKEGQMSRALASGTRAERALNEMKEDVRQQTSGQFADTMRELRQEARELAEQEQKLGEAIAGDQERRESGPPNLKDEEATDLTGEFAEQQRRLRNLMENLKDVIQEAESNEPLLSKTLYDAVRGTRTDRPEESLDMAAQFLRHGLKQEAARAETQARSGIEKLREGIEKAAESVLGNEVEALRRAEREIDALSKAIGSELAAANPQDAQSSPQQDAQRSAESRGPSESEQQEAAPTEAGESQDQKAKKSNDQGRGEGAEQQAGRRSDSPGADRPSASQESSGQQPGESSSSGSPNGDDTPQSPSSGAASDGGERNALSNFLQSGGTHAAGGGPRNGGLERPLSGADFVPWSDRMRDVEEMVEDPDLRARVAEIRDRARQMRIEMKQRHSEAPNWDLVRTSIYGPMLELRDRLAEEIARREPTDEVVPLDRDPVPDRYVELVERYYEQLGRGSVRGGGSGR